LERTGIVRFLRGIRKGELPVAVGAGQAGQAGQAKSGKIRHNKPANLGHRESRRDALTE